MDNIFDILSRRDFDVPPEAQALKAYIQRHYNAKVSITVQARTLLVVAPSAGLINTLRLNAPALQKVANTEKRLVFRIGQ
ncbi:hypothetical protein KDA06_03395 [Candidatus Saccharibacteria bacterium]|jgi:hypothetical protein|nr:hypothetical protein [Candidatus Saccharibacteria bacterium]HPR09363.1 hypothetical protein [Candidatus Saccharibacteria bacterium]